METLKYQTGAGLLWTAFFGVALMLCLANQEAWSIAPVIVVGALTALAALYTAFRSLMLIMSFATHCVVAAPMAGVRLFKFTCMVLGAGKHTENPLFRYFGFRQSVAIICALGVSLLGFGIAYLLGENLGQIALVVALPVAGLIGYSPKILDQVRSNRTVRRLLETGNPGSGDFPGATDHQRFCGTFDGDGDSWEGKTSRKQYVGQTTFESTGTPKHIFFDDPCSSMTFAAPSTGKFLTEIALQLAIHFASLLSISTKPEHADYFCARRQDPALFEVPPQQGQKHPGTDVRSKTSVRYHLAGGRSFVVDPAQQGFWPDSGYPMLHEIDPRDPVMAAQIIGALATAICPENPKANEPYFRQAAQRVIRFSMGVVCLTEPIERRNLVRCVELIKGVDARTGRADPTRFREVLLKCLKIPHLNGMLQSDASDLIQISDKQMGSVLSEVGNALTFVLPFKEHLSRPPVFSYRELGLGAPTSVFVVAPNIDKQQAATFMRCHAALASVLIPYGKPAPDAPTWICGDECPQWIGGSGLLDRAMTLRSANVKISLYAQSYPAFRDAVGEDQAASFLATATERYYGLCDEVTAERLHNLLQSRKHADGNVHKVASITDLLYSDLDPSSPLQYVKPFSGAMMRLMRRSLFDIENSYGLKLKGLPLEGHYDKDLHKPFC